MTLFTPALLFCVPLWAAACVLQSVAMAAPAQPARKKPDGEDEACPSRWLSIPFTPPPVRAP